MAGPAWMTGSPGGNLLQLLPQQEGPTAATGGQDGIRRAVGPAVAANAVAIGALIHRHSWGQQYLRRVGWLKVSCRARQLHALRCPQSMTRSVRSGFDCAQDAACSALDCHSLVVECLSHLAAGGDLCRNSG